MRVLWTHNSDPDKPNSQVYINIAADGLRRRGIDLELEYLGNLRSIPNLLRARQRVRRLSAGFDVVHAQYGSACALATAAADGVPKVLSIRGNDWSVHKETIGFYYVHTHLAGGMTRLAIGSYDCVVSTSRRLAAELMRFSPGAYVEALPSPIDLDRFVPRDKAEARALLGYPACKEKWVLFNALKLDDPIKRFPLAKAAFDLANARRGDLRFRIATDLPHASIPIFAAACDLILCTSETEGWPNSVKEALACNVPFVSTDVSDLRDIARQEPTCKICPADAKVIAESLCETLDAPEHPDLRKYVEGMSLDASSDRLIHIYESLLSRRREGAVSSPGSVRSH
jgi:teichuronic acid biosynthesis glycosyltransferase TuaC